jgi:hypothetical protein
VPAFAYNQQHHQSIIQGQLAAFGEYDQAGRGYIAVINDLAAAAADTAVSNQRTLYSRALVNLAIVRYNKGEPV